jgi:environmental stress-induced protein Ves
VEVCADAAGAGQPWTWRLSIADVPEAGPFSRFEGVDRWIARVAGAGMRIRLHATWFDVPAHGAALAFRGEEECLGEPEGAGVRDFNLMVVRAAWRAHLEIAWTGDHLGCRIEGEPAARILVHALEEPARVAVGSERVEIGPGETVVLEPERVFAERLGVEAGGRVAVALLAPQRAHKGP